MRCKTVLLCEDMLRSESRNERRTFISIYKILGKRTIKISNNRKVISSHGLDLLFEEGRILDENIIPRAILV